MSTLAARHAAGSTRVPRAALWTLFALLMLASTRLLVREAYRGWQVRESWELLYQAATLAVNYPEFGFVRRGLGGTLIYLSGLPQLTGTIVFHLLSAALVAGVGCALIAAHALERRAALLQAAVLLVLMLFWAEDAGRTDMAVAGCIGLACLAFVRGRPLLAAACLVVGLGVHESAFVYGLPLLLALGLADRRGWRLPRGRLLAAGLLIGAVAIGYAFFDHLPRADNAVVVATVRSRLGDHPLVDWAMYFALGGMRGVRTSICQNLEVDPNYALHVVSGLVVIAVGIFALLGSDRRRWGLALLAALPPYLFLSAVANDLSRWSWLACFNVWLLAVTGPAPAAARPRRWLLVHLLAALALLLLAHPRRPVAISGRIYSPSPLIEALSIRLGGPVTPGPQVFLPACDPRWAEVLSERRRR